MYLIKGIRIRKGIEQKFRQIYRKLRPNTTAKQEP